MNTPKDYVTSEERMNLNPRLPRGERTEELWRELQCPDCLMTGLIFSIAGMMVGAAVMFLYLQ